MSGPLLVALVVTAVLVPPAIWLSPRLGLIAHPDARRRHARPTGLMGGAAMYAGFAIAALIFDRGGTWLPVMIVCPGLALVLYTIDDRLRLRALWKILFGVSVALLAIFGFDAQIKTIGLPGGLHLSLGWLAAPVTLFWYLGMHNTINLLDGVDGLAGGVSATVALILLVAAAGQGLPEIAILSAALAGAGGGFLIFNWSPARIFMGDAGAHMLATALAVLSVVGVAKVPAAFALAVPVLALAIPIADTGWAIIRRRRAGRAFWHPDTQHVHHQLLDFGLTPREICVLLCCTSAILGALGLMLLGHKRVLAIAVILLLVVVSTIVGDRLGEGGGPGRRHPARSPGAGPAES